MTRDTKVNKLKNEEFKIWKKSVPSLYQHISYLKPRFNNHLEDPSQLEKKFAFTSEVVPDKRKGVLTTGLLYSLGSDIYKLDSCLPLGLQCNEEYQPLPDPQYDEVFKQTDSTAAQNPQWIFPGETITKMSFLPSSGSNSLLALSATGSLAWFQDGSKGPSHVLQEIMGPGTNFSSIHSTKNSESLAVCDFDVSKDQKQLAKCQSDQKEGQSIIKIVDNSEKIGTPLNRFNVAAAVTHSVRFLDNNLFVTCSNDNVIRFWDTRTDKELWSFCDSQDGNLISLSSSPQVNELFATGTDTGATKLWDLRAIMSSQQEIVGFYHSNEDPVVDLQFSPTCATQFLSVGKTGNVYQWDTDFFFNNEEVDEEDVHLQCLKFLHTGGSRRSVGLNGRSGMVQWHPTIDELIGTIDSDNSITVYKAFTGREEEQQDEKNEDEE